MVAMFFYPVKRCGNIVLFTKTMQDALDNSRLMGRLLRHTSSGVGRLRKTVIFFVTFSVFFLSLAYSAEEGIAIKRKNNLLFSVELRQANIRKALSTLSKEAGCSIYAQKSVQGTVSLSYENISLEKLLKKIGKGYQILFEYSRTGGEHKELRYVKIFKSGYTLSHRKNKTTENINRSEKDSYAQVVKKPTFRQIVSTEPLSGRKFIERLKVFGHLMRFQESAISSPNQPPTSLPNGLAKQLDRPSYLKLPITQFNMRKNINNRIKAYRSRVDFQTIDSKTERDGL